MIRRITITPTAGFTLLEMAVAVAILVIVVGNVYSVLSQSSHTLGKQTDAFDIEVQARRTLDRIAMALAGSKAASLYDTAEAPDFTPDLNYETYLGIQDGVQVFSDPQCIALTHDAGGEVTWFQNRGQPNERRVIWTKFVANYLGNELPNGWDDNDNSLIDETGLAFEKKGNSITIHLTISKPTPSGTPTTKTLSEVVTCRN